MSTTPPPESLPPAVPPGAGARRSRLSAGALIATAALGPLLLASTIYSQQAVRAAAKAVLYGEAQSWSRALTGRFRDLRDPRDDAAARTVLESFLAENQAEGIRYVAYLGRERRVEAGTAGSPFAKSDLQEGAVTWIGPRVRFAAPAMPFGGRPPPGFRQGPPPGLGPETFERFDHGPPPPPPDEEHGRPGEHDGPRGRGPDFGRGHPPALLVVEFEPRAYAKLVNDARRTLTLGSITALTVMLLSAWVWQSTRRRYDLERQAERARHLASLGAMSAVLAHEIRNPLASLKGHAQLLMEGLEAPGLEKPRSKASRVVDEAVRIERITSDLLDFVREGAPVNNPSDLLALVRVSAEEVVPADRLVLALPEAPLELPLDPSRLRLAIDNVIRNAVQAAEGPVEVTVSESEQAATLTVRDHGAGLPPGQEEKIFEPFVTTRTRGTGLGLAIARRIVERHGGTLTGANHPEGGALFRITLPKKAQER